MIPPKAKCQLCKHLPPEWYFYFEEESKNPVHRGLVLVRENRVKKWKSFEGAQRFACKQFEGYSAMNFYRHVGLAKTRETHPPPEATTTTTTTGSSQGTVLWTLSADLAARKPAPQEEQNQPWSLRKIHTARCGRCQNCQRDSCGACQLCRRLLPSSERQFWGCYQRVSFISPTNAYCPFLFFKPYLVALHVSYIIPRCASRSTTGTRYRNHRICQRAGCFTFHRTQSRPMSW